MTPENLYTPGDGLYDTHVTWEDIEEDMKRELNTTSSFGPKKSAKDIGDGNGFMAKILLIEPDWQRKDDKKLPQNFIVKIVTQLVMQKFTSEISKAKNVNNNFTDPKFMSKYEALQKRCHNTEVAVFDYLKRIPEGEIVVPKVYCARKFSKSNPVKGYIIMEYLKNIEEIHVFENVTPSQLKQILHYKAVLEAYSLDVTSEERKEFNEEAFNNIYNKMFKQEVQEHIVAMFESFKGKKLAESAAQLQKIIPDVMDLKRAENLADELGMERVLCHGDLWSMNILWKPSKNGLTLAAVIDYQTAHFGCSATDLVRMFCACLSGKDRRAHWEELLEEFYGYLQKEVEGRKMPYTLEQLKEAYRRYFPMGAFMIVSVMGPLFEAVFKNPDENEKKKGLECLIEKTECLMDDIFYYHERNQKIQNGDSVD